jgi:TetR/AcrR family transcriptional repressor of nem operon
MNAIGLTHGGFYTHFGSREDLFGEVVSLAMGQFNERLATSVAANGFDGIAKSYLTRYHRDSPGTGCALPALAADIARASLRTRRVFSERFEDMVNILAASVEGDSPKVARRKATAAISTMVGAMVLARAAPTSSLSDEILEAGRVVLADLGEAKKMTNRKTGKSTKS